MRYWSTGSQATGRMGGSLDAVFVLLSAVVFRITKVHAQGQVPGCTQCSVICGGGPGETIIQTLQAACTGPGSSEPCAMCISTKSGPAFSYATSRAGAAAACTAQVPFALDILVECASTGSVASLTTGSVTLGTQMNTDAVVSPTGF
jgi:hypothetical protein